VKWQATVVPWLFSELRADLEIAPVGGWSTQISLFGLHDPPLGVADRIADATVLHRVAQASVPAFLRLIAGHACSDLVSARQVDRARIRRAEFSKADGGRRVAPRA
jgi:hypothetical protein